MTQEEATQPTALQKLYRMDEDKWRERNIQLLHEGKLSEIDAINIAVCLVEMGNSEDRSFKSYVRLSIRHLLLLRYSSDKSNLRHWSAEALAFQKLLFKNFTSKNWINKYIKFVEECYEDALEEAEEEYPGADFPKENPFTINEVYGKDPTL
jgi:hypothetical protein